MKKLSKTKERQIGIKPSGAFILVQADPKQELKSKSGIILSGQEDGKQRFRTGKVLDLGPGVVLPNGHRTVFNVKPDDKILYKDFTGYPIETDKEDAELIFILESDILGIL